MLGVPIRKILSLAALMSWIVALPLSAQTRMAELPLGKSLNVHLRIQKRCMFGDFDVLKLDMQYSRDAKVKLALLSADGSREYGQDVFSSFNSGAGDKDIPKAIATLFDAGERVSVPLPTKMKDGVYALVLCKVSKGKEGCAQTPVVDLNTVLDKYKQTLGEYEVPEDHIYFYQPLLVRSGKVQAFSKTISPETLEYARTGMTEANMVLDEHVESVLQRASVVMSNPLELFSNEIVVNLPMYNKTKCEG
jgi:hypothetical protein